MRVEKSGSKDVMESGINVERLTVGISDSVGNLLKLLVWAFIDVCQLSLVDFHDTSDPY